MYLNHYQLSAKPFGLSPNPDFLWLGEKHEEALATLKYGVASDMGFLLMTGDVGVGKTALINRLLSSLDSSTIFAHITDPGLSTYDFYRMLSAEFRLETDVRNKAEFLLELEKFLRAANADGRRVLLIVDEAQRLNDKLLDEIRVLSNIELSHRKLINIFFVGQPEFIDLLSAPKNRAIRQRIGINYHVHPLTEAEVGRYIEHRLQVAGAAHRIFQPEAFQEIFRITGGFPRAINILCDHALLEGYITGSTVIDAKMVKACERELDIRAGLTPPAREPRPAPASIPPQPAGDSEPSDAPPAPAPQKRSTRAAWFIGAAVIAAVLAGYYWWRVAPNLSVQREPPPTIAQSEKPPTDRVVDESAPSPSAAPEAAAGPPAPPAAENGQPSQGNQTIAADPTPDPTPEKIVDLPPPPQSLSPYMVAGNDNAASTTPAASADLGAGTDGIPPLAGGTDASPSPAVAGSETAPAPPMVAGLDQRDPAQPVDTGESGDAPNEAAATPPPERATDAADAPEAADSPEIQPEPAAVAALNEDAPEPPAERTNGAAVGRTPPPTASEPEPPPPPAAERGATTDATAAAATTTAGPVLAAVDTDSPPTPQRQPAQRAEGEKIQGPAAPETPTEADDRPSVPAVPPAAPSPERPPTPDTASTPASSDTTPGPTLAATDAEPPSTVPAAQADPPAMEDRLRSFLSSYTGTYSDKDLDRFTSFFADNATENGKPFASLLPKYERNFNLIETIEYRIELQDFSRDAEQDIVQIEGAFFLRWLPPDKQWRENAGTIRMRLQASGDSFLVQRLDYQGGGSQNN